MHSQTRRATFVFLMVTLASVFLMGGVAQALLVKMSPQKMTRVSRRVVVADVWSVSARHVKPAHGPGWGTIVTVVRLGVTDDVKGAGSRWITLRIPGGAADGRTRVVEDAPAFYAGERVLLFLDDHGVVGWREGVLEIVHERVPAMGGLPLRDVTRRLTDVAAGRRVTPVARSRAPIPPVGPVVAAAPVPAKSLQLPSDAVLRAAPRSTQTLLSDSFEGTMGSWTTYGSPTWGITGTRAQAGTKSAYCAQSTIAAPGPYANNMNNWMIVGPYNLSDATAATLDFYGWWALGAGDSFYYGFSTDGGSFSLGGWTANSSGGWAHVAQDMSNWFGTSYLGQPSVWVAYRFVSDASTTAEGAYVDNVVLSKNVVSPTDPTITNINPGSASAGTGTNVTVTGTNYGATQGTGGVTFYYNSTDRITAPIISWSDTQIVCTVPTGLVKGYAASAGSGPVIVTNNAGASSPGYTFTVTFGYGGVKWPSPAATYTLNANCVDTAGETALIDAAWPIWNPPALWTLSRVGTNVRTALPTSSDSSRDIFWSQTSLGTGVLAVNQYWYSGSTITDSDIAFNDADFTWGDGTVAGTYDIQSVATHELGHTINLRDLYGPGDTGDIMYGMTASATQKRSLSADDTAGAVWVYGARPLMSGNVGVNSNATWTTSATVTLNSAVVNATQMHFQNQGGSWSGYEAYAATKAGWTLVAGDGAKTVNAEYKDAGGNVYAQSDTIILDGTAPVTTDNAGAGWHAGPFTLTLTPFDATSGMSGGAAKTELSTNGGATWVSSLTRSYVIWRRSGGSGQKAVQYRSTDAAGNVESVKPITVKIDGSKPWTSDNAPLGPQATPVTVTLTGHDAYSGIGAVWYSLDNGSWTQGVSVLVAAPADHSNDGIHTIRYYSVDNVGNVGPGYRVCMVTIAT